MSVLKKALLVVLVLTLTAIMLAAAVWQTQRGLQKQALAEQRADAQAAAPSVFSAATAYGQRVQLTGEFDSARQILLDNQVRDGRVGVHVWTPLRLASGVVVMINRGWVPASPDRQQLPTWQTPDGAVSLHGFWTRLPRAGMAVANADCSAPQWPARMVYPNHGELACLYDAPLANGIVQLGADAPHGFARDWRLAGLTPSRHFGYALQWAALTVCLWILTFIAWKRRDRSPIKR